MYLHFHGLVNDGRHASRKGHNPYLLHGRTTGQLVARLPTKLVHAVVELLQPLVFDVSVAVQQDAVEHAAFLDLLVIQVPHLPGRRPQTSASQLQESDAVAVGARDAPCVRLVEGAPHHRPGRARPQVHLGAPAVRELGEVFFFLVVRASQAVLHQRPATAGAGAGAGAGGGASAVAVAAAAQAEASQGVGRGLGAESVLLLLHVIDMTHVTPAPQALQHELLHAAGLRL